MGHLKISFPLHRRDLACPSLEQYQAELVENFFINILQLCPDTMKLQREGFQRKKFLEFSKLVLTHITKAWRLTVETLK